MVLGGGWDLGNRFSRQKTGPFIAGPHPGAHPLGNVAGDSPYVQGASFQDLPALCSGAPAFAETIHVGRPNMPCRERFLDRIDQMLSSRWLTNHGPLNDEFERSVAEIAGTRHCIATCNGTVALELAISALGMRGEVIVPSFTFVATVHALARQGIRPVFCDIDPDTHCLDVAKVEEAITSETTGILGVHLWGNVCATRALEDLARRTGLKLLFDAAHAFGCATDGRSVGTAGDAEVFSFHATKFVHSIEGGAIVTNELGTRRPPSSDGQFRVL